MVAVPKQIYEQLEDVRESGETNMLDVGMVQVVASDRGHYALVTWLEDQMDRRSYGSRMIKDAPYTRGVFEGFEPVEEEEEEQG